MINLNPNCLTCNVRDCLLMKHCEREHLATVQAFKHQFQFRKGDTIFREGDPVRGVHFIQAGVVKQELNGTKGRPFILKLANHGQPMGHRSILNGEPQPFSATAVEDSRVCFIELEFFRNLVRKSEGMRNELDRTYLREINLAESRLLGVAHQSVREKIAFVLLHLAEIYNYQESGSGIKVQIDRQEMADMAGTTKEQVSKVLAQFTREKVIRFRAKHFKNLDIGKLRKIVDKMEVGEAICA
ncbi:MAG: Crp/Fnr family transcriptional regulator [Chitinophagaceae bacterium]|jgi:CRP/FNR family transcriptional regulator|nr:Crp/Fnr family transcriptional regulator [Chitinophagaceae bacterium]